MRQVPPPERAVSPVDVQALEKLAGRLPNGLVTMTEEECRALILALREAVKALEAIANARYPEGVGVAAHNALARIAAKVRL